MVNLLQYQTPFDAAVMDECPSLPLLLLKSPPWNDTIRKAVRVHRGKSPGPDRIRPFPFFVLHEPLWAQFCALFRPVLFHPEDWPVAFCSTLIGFHKKGDPTETHAWRLIALCNSRYCIAVWYLLLEVNSEMEQWVGPTQFGTR